MRTALFALSIGLVASLLPGPQVACRDYGSIDLFGRNMKDWSRLGTGKNPWRLTGGNTLYCDRGNDLYIAEQEFGDGTLTFEYRFRPTGEETGYAGAVSVRRSADSTGCKIALGDDCGALSASFLGSSDREKFVSVAPADKFARRVGDWNSVEIRMIGRTVEVFINGRSAASFDNANERGVVGLHAEGSEMEFRSMVWTEAK
jgi:3-keto-disaccharide hydrolase